MRTSFFTALAAIVSVAAALPTGTTTLMKRQDPTTFELIPAPGAPAELQSLGSLWFKYNDRLGGEMGWYSETTDKVAQLFIQYNAQSGITFYAYATRLQAYLVATQTGGTCYQAKIANPEFETEETKSDNFTLFTKTTDNVATELFGYAGESKWLACPNSGIYDLYYGDSCAEDCLALELATKYVPWGL